MKTPLLFKHLDETRFLFVLLMPNVIEEYPIKKIRGVPDSNFMDITIYKMKNTVVGNADAMEALVKSAGDANIPTLTFRVNKESSNMTCTLPGNTEVWSIFPSKQVLLEFIEKGSGKNVKLQ